MRSIIKAGLWTAIGLVVMTGVGFGMTGYLGTGGAMAVTNSVIGMVSYVIYERVWAWVRWGRRA